MKVGYFQCEKGHWVDFLPNYEKRCPVCGRPWIIEKDEREIAREKGYFMAHRPSLVCDCHPCRERRKVEEEARR